LGPGRGRAFGGLPTRPRHGRLAAVCQGAGQRRQREGRIAPLNVLEHARGLHVVTALHLDNALESACQVRRWSCVAVIGLLFIIFKSLFII